MTQGELELQVGVAKVSKYAVNESGDTLEMVERPLGGISLVMADGQRSGKSAKRISNLVVRKAISLLAEGVRDGAAARAAHDYLRLYRQGQVSAELHIVSVDLVTRTIVVSRNSHCPVILLREDEIRMLEGSSRPIGIYAGTKPTIDELPIADSTWLIACTDGIISAGQRYGASLDLLACARTRLADEPSSAQTLADDILLEAMALDHGRPEDDMCVLVLAIRQSTQADPTRRMTVRFPLPPSEG